VLSELTEQREKELKTWADGILEGDVCNGSVKTAQVDDERCKRLAKGTSLGTIEEPMQRQKAYLWR
jgi:hypothetical protein